jgi:molecular chaperone GrpE
MTTDETHADGPVKVVDRRWWHKSDAGASTGTDPDAGRVRKPSYVEDLEQQLAEKDKAIQAHAQRYRDSSAEFEQVRARLRRDIDKDIERARRTILADFLDVADNLDRALAAAAASGQADPPLLKGVQLVRDLLLSKLASYGVTPIAAEGVPFDPRLHEALSVVPIADPSRDDLVVSVIRAGYAIGDDILRPATVAVGRLAP